MACELPAKLGVPLSRFSRAELRRYVLAEGIVAEMSGVTIWRWLREDAIRPWTHRSWIFPRDPAFTQKAGPVLDLYHQRWKGRRLGPRDFVLSADEKTQIQQFVQQLLEEEVEACWAERRVRAGAKPRYEAFGMPTGSRGSSR